MVDWSYDLLFDEERRVFERMSVFAGACPLEAAEQVCADDPVGVQNVADLLARLVDKSLVTATPTGRGIRFGVLQTLAQYGQERLAARGSAPIGLFDHRERGIRLLDEAGVLLQAEGDSQIVLTTVIV